MIGPVVAESVVAGDGFCNDSGATVGAGSDVTSAGTVEDATIGLDDVASFVAVGVLIEIGAPVDRPNCNDGLFDGVSLVSTVLWRRFVGDGVGRSLFTEIENDITFV